MTTVSILIPAHRSEFLSEAIASALAQTFQDIEILVGDNTPNGALEHIVSAFGSPKLKYFHHGFDNGGQNAAALWDKANGKYVKWLFYDDVLMPTSVDSLVQALRLYPQAVMAFHERAVIDASGAVLLAPQRLLQDGHAGLIDRSFIVRTMVPRMNNFIGEPSCIMLDKDRIHAAELRQYKGYVPGFLGDVCAYLAVAQQGPIAAVGGYLGAFRRHGAQESADGSPIFSMGLIEWEVFLRGEAADGNLSLNEILMARQYLEHTYSCYVARFPELQRFIEGLSDLTDELPRNLFSSEKFQANLTYAKEVVKARNAVVQPSAA
ncbi:glycosyltransferase family 2 protein [Trinickia symbiotica]|uniref:glycosyltransferase family 2 protein n=1 Tax=Trinickia symbiotica TaxID=863227 RepID=UPI0015E728C2|nr:glycosyltransferase [Trinickia symbiotica]